MQTGTYFMNYRTDSKTCHDSGKQKAILSRTGKTIEQIVLG
jgi:hypothetical protein